MLGSIKKWKISVRDCRNFLYIKEHLYYLLGEIQFLGLEPSKNQVAVVILEYDWFKMIIPCLHINHTKYIYINQIERSQLLWILSA